MVTNLSEALKLFKEYKFDGSLCKKMTGDTHLGNCQSCIITKLKKEKHINFYCGIDNHRFIVEILEAEVRKQKLKELLK